MNDCICPNRGAVYRRHGCPVHDPENAGCTCQYGVITPPWYITVKTCPCHAAQYDPMQAPAWAATQCGEEGAEVWRDRQHALLTSANVAEGDFATKPKPPAPPSRADGQQP